MLYHSTRSEAHFVDSAEAVLEGLAPDGGLYMPESIPAFDWQACLRGSSTEMSAKILAALLPDIPDMDTLVRRAYQGKFETEDLTPTVSVGGYSVLELFRGPTSAFKDVALSMLPQLLTAAKAVKGMEKDILILTATSGDTGKAALEGFRDVPGVRICVFYPDGGVSQVQRAQMVTQEGSNVAVSAVRGNFDDAQTGVKNIFAACQGRELPYALSSANSINIGRLAPQIVYYYDAYLKLVRAGRIRMSEAVDFSVPTGNFGDILAGYLARLSGLPVGRLICASNANNVLTDFFNTAVYDKNRPFLTTTSPSMDILVSSNLERLVYLALNRDAAAVRERMEQLRNQGRYALPEEAMARIRACFTGVCASDQEGMDAIARVYREHGYLMDPHTAVAWRGMEKAGTGSAPCVVLSTASPCKFPACVLTALGQSVPQEAQAQLDALTALGAPLPRALEGVLQRPVRFSDVIVPQDMMAYVQGKAAGK